MGKHGKGRLEDILISGLLDNRDSTPSILHKVMQISTFAYIDSRQNVYFAATEPTLLYTEPRLKYKENVGWNADLLVKYVENGKKIAEIVETETINLIEYWMRIDRINRKYEIVEKVVSSKDNNNVLKDVDEIRFSLAVNCQDMKNELMDVLVAGFMNDLDWQKYHVDVVPHNLYVLKKNLYNYCPTDINSGILSPRSAVRGKWKAVLREGLMKVYSSLYKNRDELDSLYSQTRIERSGEDI